MLEVLLVEDEEVIRRGLKKVIEELVPGYQVTAEASNGQEGLNFLQIKEPDLLVTDIRMSEMNGLELIRRAREFYPRLPVLIISGHDDFPYVRQALHYGVADYLLKPVDRLELVQFLEKLKSQREPASTGLPLAAKANAKEEKETRRIIRRVKELVQERLNQAISLNSLGAEVNLNPKYLSDLFKSSTGQSFTVYVTDLRMQRARQLLRETNLKIYEIAPLCGYASAKHFTVAFKQHTGASPTDFRD